MTRPIRQWRAPDSHRVIAWQTKVHRIHVHSYGRQELTSRLFSLFRLWSQAKYVGEFTASMEDIIQDEAERVCTPPPPEEVAVVEAFKSAVASVGEESYLALLPELSAEDAGLLRVVLHALQLHLPRS